MDHKQLRKSWKVRVSFVFFTLSFAAGGTVLGLFFLHRVAGVNWTDRFNDSDLWLLTFGMGAGYLVATTLGVVVWRALTRRWLSDEEALFVFSGGIPYGFQRRVAERLINWIR